MSEEAQAQPAIADLSGEGNVEGVQKQEAAPQEPIPPLDPAQVAWQQQMQQYTEYWKSHQPSQGQAAPFYTGGGVSHPFGLWPAQSMMYGSPFYGHAGMAPYYPPSTMAPAAGQLAEAAEAVAALNPNGKHSFAPGGLPGGESKGAGGVVDEGNAQENGESLGKARLPVKIKQDPPAHVSLPEASIIGSGAAALAALAAAQVRSVVMPGAVASTELWHPHHSVVQATSEQRSVREDSPDSPAGYQDEREQKRQKRKQSNRESARRSRLRKQAECETLGSQVSDLKRQIAEQADRIVQLEKELAQYKGRS